MCGHLGTLAGLEPSQWQQLAQHDFLVGEPQAVQGSGDRPLKRFASRTNERGHCTPPIRSDYFIYY